MSGNGILLDSVILIDHLNGVVPATEYLRSVGREANISAITRAEVLTGLAGVPRETAARFLDCFRFRAIDREVADLAAELRREHGWKLPDAFQAAVALHHELAFATRNVSDFPPASFPFVVVPYTLTPRTGVGERARRPRRRA
jgi:hypothetical protein